MGFPKTKLLMTSTLLACISTGQPQTPHGILCSRRQALCQEAADAMVKGRRPLTPADPHSDPGRHPAGDLQKMVPGHGRKGRPDASRRGLSTPHIFMLSAIRAFRTARTLWARSRVG